MSKLSKDTLDKTICLTCGSGVMMHQDDNAISCPACGMQWPVVRGVPILINDGEGLFKINQFLELDDTTYKRPKSRFMYFVFKHLPAAEVNVASKHNYELISELMKQKSSVLVIGGGVDGQGFEAIRKRRDLDIVSTDVALQDKTDMICDAHNLPFRDESFDCVIIQAVLEHVLDPQQCVGEACRVLRKDGLIYSETPFMQQVHMGAYDFQRFTKLGHRWLFRNFEEISSGAVCGTGAALCWSIIYFAQSFTSKRKIKTLLHAAFRLLSFPIKYFDYLTCKTKGSEDGASGFYFLGRKSTNVLSCQDLIKSYGGLT